ncbi:phage tail tape measure protein, partial [Wolbachia pipientis]|nr:phage tail tape measure protein [Wolbachia pipientis]
KAFETPVETKIGKVVAESNVLSNGNPLLNNKEISESGKSIIGNAKIGSIIEEKSSVADDLEKVLKDCEKCKYEQKIFNQTFTFNISIKAEPNQDVRSLADEVIKRIREKSRDVMFDTVDPIY